MTLRFPLRRKSFLKGLLLGKTILNVLYVGVWMGGIFLAVLLDVDVASSWWWPCWFWMCFVGTIPADAVFLVKLGQHCVAECPGHSSRALCYWVSLGISFVDKALVAVVLEIMSDIVIL